jgi:hypothetical protein
VDISTDRQWVRQKLFGYGFEQLQRWRQPLDGAPGCKLIAQPGDVRSSLRHQHSGCEMDQLLGSSSAGHTRTLGDELRAAEIQSPPSVQLQDFAVLPKPAGWLVR